MRSDVSNYIFLRSDLTLHLLQRSGTFSSVLEIARRGGGLGSSTIFKKFNEPYGPS